MKDFHQVSPGPVELKRSPAVAADKGVVNAKQSPLSAGCSRGLVHIPAWAVGINIDPFMQPMQVGVPAFAGQFATAHQSNGAIHPV